MKKIITLLLPLLSLLTHSSFAGDRNTTQNDETPLPLIEFQKYFQQHKKPTTEMLLKKFGKPVLGHLLIKDSIAAENGEHELKAERAWWSYKLQEKNLSIQIAVYEGKVRDVYVYDSSGEKPKITLLKDIDR